MKILLTGVNGQVGWELRRTLATFPKWDTDAIVVADFNICITGLSLKLTTFLSKSLHHNQENAIF